MMTHVFAALLLMLGQMPQEEIDAMLRLQLTTPAARPRTSAMVPVDARFNVNTGDLLRGRLILDVSDPVGPITTWTSAPLALTRGQTLMQLNLPPFNSANIDGVATVTARLVGDNQRLELGSYALPAPTWHNRNTTMLVSDPWRGSTQRYTELVRALRIETIAPPIADRMVQQQVTTMPVRIAPEDFPAEPLGYTAYDIVMLAAEGFAQLTPNQLDAIAAWVEAGGSVLVIPGRQLDRHHQLFLEGLRAGVRVREGAYQVELGRAVIQDDMPPLADIAFLWKLGAEQQQIVADTGVWSLKLEDKQWRRQHLGWDSDMIDDMPPLYHPQPLAQVGQLVNLLKPTDMKLMPMHLIVGILAAYVLLIGPVDYFVLGKLKLRRLTWLTFPIITAAITVTTVYATNQYMGRADHHRQLVIVDVSADNRELRRNTLTLYVLGASATIARDGRQTVTSMPDLNRMHAQFFANAAQTQRHGSTLEGRFPSHYSIATRIEQWSPTMVRELTIDPKPLDAEVDWSRAKVLTADGPFSNDASRDVMFDLTRRPRQGFFSIVSQVAPHGGPLFEDLAMLDSSDPRQQVAIVEQRRGDDIYIYRKLTVKDSPPGNGIQSGNTSP